MKSYPPEVYDRTEGDTAMIKLQGLFREQVREIASQTADAFYDYRYHDGDTGLTSSASRISQPTAMTAFPCFFCASVGVTGFMALRMSSG